MLRSFFFKRNAHLERNWSRIGISVTDVTIFCLSFRGFWNKEMKIQNKGAVLVQIARLFISQPRDQNQSHQETWDP